MSEKISQSESYPRIEYRDFEARDARNESIDDLAHLEAEWKEFGGLKIDRIRNQQQEAGDVRFNPELHLVIAQRLESVENAFYNAATAGMKNPGTREEVLQSYLDERARLELIADQRQVEWESLGGDAVDIARGKIESLDMRLQPAEYLDAVLELEDAEAAVEAALARGTDDSEVAVSDPETVSLGTDETVNDRISYEPNWKLYTEENTNSEAAPKVQAVTAETGAQKQSEDVNVEVSSEKKRRSAKMLSEGAIWVSLQESILRYETGLGKFPWDRLQQNLLAYEQAYNERRKREINEAIDAAYAVATEHAPEISEERREPVAESDSIPAEEAPSAAVETPETEAFTEVEAAEATSTPTPTTRKTKLFARAKRASKRMRSRLNKTKRTRAQNITRIRQEAREIGQPEYAKFSDKVDVEQGSLGDLVRDERLGHIPHGSDRLEHDDSTDAKAA